MTTATKREADLAFIKENLGIDPATTSQAEAHKILREAEINTTSWVLDVLAKEYAEQWAEAYRKSIASETCYHGFLGSCPYCKWGTD